MVALPIRHPLPSIHPSRPRPVWSGPSKPSGQYGPSLQANFSHTGKRPEGLNYSRNTMIPLSQVKIKRDNIKHRWSLPGNYPSLKQNLVIYPSFWRIMHDSCYPQFLQNLYIHIYSLISFI